MNDKTSNKNNDKKLDSSNFAKSHNLGRLLLALLLILFLIILYFIK